MRLSLGTVQFGCDYGINNRSGRINIAEAKQIIDFAKNNEIDTIDTAVNYGSAEEILGQIGVKKFKIITKIPLIPDDVKNIYQWIENTVFCSLKKLMVKELYGLLIHDSRQLNSYKGEEILQSLQKLKDKGLIKKSGVSIYTPTNLKKFFKVKHLDLVQSPLNIIDQRLIDSGMLSFFKKQGVEIHSRSIFLQGLLFMSKKDLYDKFNEWNYLWDKWFAFLEKTKLTPLEISIQFQKNITKLDRVTIGIDNLNQLKKIVLLINENSKNFIPNIKSNDENLIDPRKWSKS